MEASSTNVESRSRVGLIDKVVHSTLKVNYVNTTHTAVALVFARISPKTPLMTQNPQPPEGRRIGVVSYDFNPPIGGLGVLVRTYLESMKRLFPRDTTIVISPAPNADERGAPLGYRRYRCSGGCPLFSVVLSFTLPALIRKHRLDLLHVHAGSGGVFLLRRPTCPLVVTAHHTYRQEADLVFRRQPLQRVWKLFMSILESRTYRRADTVVCVSRDTADAIVHQYGVPANRVCVIENPVDVAPADSLQDLVKHPESILFVGRLEERKGIMLLLNAFELLRKDLPTAKLRLIGSNLIGERLTKMIASRGLSGSVEMLGFVDDARRFREMTQATVLVVPSLLEGFGLVAAESMVLGTCVVASDAPGLRSVISSGRTGLLFPVGDALACAEALKRVLADHSLRKRLETAARQDALLRFDLQKRSRDLADVYARILGR